MSRAGFHPEEKAGSLHAQLQLDPGHKSPFSLDGTLHYTTTGNISYSF